MRKELEQIETIERYINGELHGTEKVAFESQLSYDSILRDEVQLQKDLLGGLDRKVLKGEIQEGLKQYNRGRKIKRNLSIAASIVIVGMSAFFIYPSENKQRENQPVAVTESSTITPAENDNNVNSIIVKPDESQTTSEKIISAPKKESRSSRSYSTKVTGGSNLPTRGKPFVFPNQIIPDNIVINAAGEVVEKQASDAVKEDSEVNKTDENSISDVKRSNEIDRALIPNAFSPNGDGINDIFQINIEGITDIKCAIYTLRGEKIYEWAGSEGFWDGRIGAEKAQGNVYIYHLKVKTSEAQDFGPIQAGTVTLIR